MTISPATIEGTYLLARWEALGGAQDVPPIQHGTMTFTAHKRIFTFVGQDENGNPYSELYVAGYRLSAETYTETPEVLVLDLKHGQAPARYTFGGDGLGGNSVASSVKVAGDEITFDLPHEFERSDPVTVTFSETMMKAVVGGQVVYYWERVS